MAIIDPATADTSSAAAPSAPAEVESFIRHETHLLNEERYEEWLGLLSDDFDYRLPTPQVRDDPRIRPYSDSSVLAWESVHSLRLRFERIQTDYAWADRPPAFHRRHLTAVRVTPGVRPGEWTVQCDEIVARSRVPEGTHMVSAVREDVVREEGGRLTLARRTVYVHLNRPSLAQIALLF
jgi:3-phenylpropionate/cinnamic acid dioxygenase small subunit